VLPTNGDELAKAIRDSINNADVALIERMRALVTPK